MEGTTNEKREESLVAHRQPWSVVFSQPLLLW